MILLYRCFVVIGIGGNAVFHLEEIISIAVHVRFRRSSKAYQERVEILKNGPVFFENAAVALVNDNQVKVGRGEQPLSVL